ncbi:olfactory receptor 52P1-like [Hemicordylus capensis]|uniref:olfactory receptor 52P1-like n=1 Tax=Hemicordylus capensis TaxID=884348 RepID=UPI0023046440|nr:olfactory receptor 52P1-like [Hemicordylus capensis]
MSTFNGNSTCHPSIFFLVGIPGLETAHIWLGIPLCFIYVVTVVGNCTIMFIIWVEDSLHEPMYWFLCMLAMVDLAASTSVVPKMLCLFWFGSREIRFEACLTQMFSILALSITESAILLAMAFDCYMAICQPLRYAAILTNPALVKIGCLAVARAAILTAPFPILASRLPYCRTNVVPHTYCKHMGIVRLPCAGTVISNLYGLTVAVLVVGLDLTFIGVSYAKIILTVLRLPSREAQAKAFNTCGSHICVIILAYTPALFSFLTHRFGHSVAPYILIGNFYILVPPFCNPIVYGVKTKLIRDKVVSLLLKRKGVS